ncbi:uncharacterized protein METZ01_LOCUS54824 [marine metagenome]|uniref:CDP-glycerol:poly(Glycerophosphate) glycerophosphotransferase n=1 Tax=marine metagenome TaxID=408172 RepID=A0A381SD27_9ZZZZ
MLRIRYQGFRLWLHYVRFLENLLESLIRCWLLKGELLHTFLNNSQPYLHSEKQALIDNGKTRKVIFFTFRTLHFLDWFAPIHLALERLFPEKYEVFYINFGSTQHRIGVGFEYIRYHRKVEERMLLLGVSPLRHFSHQELAEYSSIPEPAVHLTCESIRQETFSVPERIYLPHYALPKAIDTGLPENIRFNHVFLPTRPPYTYQQLNQKFPGNVKVHSVGYPKLHAVHSNVKRFNDDERPVVIYAPSLEIKLLFDALDKGLLDIIKKLTQYLFVIKLHPSLASRRHYVTSFISRQLKDAEHIQFNDLAGIQELAEESSVMITDYGSAGGEYRMGFGRRIICLKVPEEYEGGADLRFRDDFADAVCEVGELELVIESVINKGDLSFSELQDMREKVLSFPDAADEAAARTINEICSSR